MRALAVAVLFIRSLTLLACSPACIALGHRPARAPPTQTPRPRHKTPHRSSASPEVEDLAPPQLDVGSLAAARNHGHRPDVRVQLLGAADDECAVTHESTAMPSPATMPPQAPRPAPVHA